MRCMTSHTLLLGGLKRDLREPVMLVAEQLAEWVQCVYSVAGCFDDYQ